MATLEEQLEPTLGRWGRELRSGRALTLPLRRTADDIATEQLRQLKVATGSGGLSNYPRRGRSTRGTVETVVKRDRSTLKANPPGLWGLVQAGARPHLVGAPRQVLRFNGRFVTGPTRHPGMRPLGRIEISDRFMADSWNDSVRQDLSRRRIV